jgi:hypothetical protein
MSIALGASLRAVAIKSGPFRGPILRQVRPQGAGAEGFRWGRLKTIDEPKGSGCAGIKPD